MFKLTGVTRDPMFDNRDDAMDALHNVKEGTMFRLTVVTRNPHGRTSSRDVMFENRDDAIDALDKVKDARDPRVVDAWVVREPLLKEKLELRGIKHLLIENYEPCR